MSDGRRAEGLREGVRKKLPANFQYIHNRLGWRNDPQHAHSILHYTQQINYTITNIDHAMEVVTRGSDTASANVRIRWANFKHQWNNGNGDWAECQAAVGYIMGYLSVVL